MCLMKKAHFLYATPRIQCLGEFLNFPISHNKTSDKFTVDLSLNTTNHVLIYVLLDIPVSFSQNV